MLFKKPTTLLINIANQNLIKCSLKINDIIN